MLEITLEQKQMKMLMLIHLVVDQELEVMQKVILEAKDLILDAINIIVKKKIFHLNIFFYVL